MSWQGMVIAALLVAVAVLLWLWWRAVRRTGRENRARQVIASAGEAAAERLLARDGYRVVDRQVSRVWTLEVDGESWEVLCRADLLVEDADGARFVAEVKTGRLAPEPTRPATRRQLLEYWLVFPVDGVLLVDMAAGRVRAVRFNPEAMRGASRSARPR